MKITPEPAGPTDRMSGFLFRQIPERGVRRISVSRFVTARYAENREAFSSVLPEIGQHDGKIPGRACLRCARFQKRGGKRYQGGTAVIGKIIVPASSDAGIFLLPAKR